MGFIKKIEKKEKEKVMSSMKRIASDKELLSIWRKVHELEQALSPVEGWDRDCFFHWTKLPR